jgi:hypothetical protein
MAKIIQLIENKANKNVFGYVCFCNQRDIYIFTIVKGDEDMNSVA